MKTKDALNLQGKKHLAPHQRLRNKILKRYGNENAILLMCACRSVCEKIRYKLRIGGKPTAYLRKVNKSDSIKEN